MSSRPIQLIITTLWAIACSHNINFPFLNYIITMITVYVPCVGGWGSYKRMIIIKYNISWTRSANGSLRIRNSLNSLARPLRTISPTPPTLTSTDAWTRIGIRNGFLLFQNPQRFLHFCVFFPCAKILCFFLLISIAATKRYLTNKYESN